MKVFLDMDGVLVDFFNACLLIHGCTKWNEENWPQEWDIPGVIGLSHNEFWKPIDDHFWENVVELYGHAPALIKFLAERQIKPCLLTSPSIGGATGKQLFIKKHLPEFFREKRYLIGPAKEFCAGPDTLLIDDYDKNCRVFQEAGGSAIVFPQPWNSMRGESLHGFFKRLTKRLNRLSQSVQEVRE